MASAKLKEILQKLSLIKSYSTLIIPILIALIGVLLFIPTKLMSDKLKDRVQKESVSPGRKAFSLMKNVPSREQWKQEQVYQQAYEKDAEQIALLPIESSQRELLSYKIFPKPQDTSSAIFEEFGERYRASIQNLFTQINAQDSPTQAVINSRIGNNKSGQRNSSISPALRDAIHQEVAQSISVYANPTVLSGYNFWESYESPGTDKAVTDCWYWQLAYWIIEDVFTTVGAINYGSNSVFTSPVKRIMSVNFESSGGTRALGIGISSKSSSTPPKYVSTIADEFAQSFTGRLSNDVIDVVHFNISVIINVEAVPRFMQELCQVKQHTFRGFTGTDEEKSFKHNLITILDMQLNPVDKAAPEHQRYRYGEASTVNLDLICEYIFIKAGYDAIIPDVIKNKKTTTK